MIAERDVGDGAADDQLRAELKQIIADRFQVRFARVHLVEPGWWITPTSGKVGRNENVAKLQRQPPPDAPAERPGGLAQVVIDTIASPFGVLVEHLGASR